MRRFLKNLFQNFCTTQTDRRPLRRTSLQLEGLDDRILLSSAMQSNAILIINPSPSRVITIAELNPTGNRQIEVFDNIQGKIGQFSINTINTVDFALTGMDRVDIDDSNGMPFATGSTIYLYGNGGEANNSLTLSGSRVVSGTEKYLSADDFGNSTILLDNLTFNLTNVVSSVTDTIPITGGVYDVETSGQHVGLLGSITGTTQTLRGLNATGGGSLTYSHKPTVQLNEYAANANITLNAVRSESTEKYFEVQMWGAEDTIAVQTTPSNVLTFITAGNSDQDETLAGNTGPVLFQGNSSTYTFLGQAVGHGEFSTKGIQARVSVVGAGLVILSDSGNTTTQEHVTVTESSISGSGLFGNNSAEVTFDDVVTLSILSGQLADSYEVAGSSTGVEFGTQINIFDDSTVRFNAGITVEDHNQLNVQLFNTTLQTDAFLYIYNPDNPSSIQFGPNYPGPNSYVNFDYSDGQNSHVAFNGFPLVEISG
jgi:hypothetical protein